MDDEDLCRGGGGDLDDEVFEDYEDEDDEDLDDEDLEDEDVETVSVCRGESPTGLGRGGHQVWPLKQFPVQCTCLLSH